jgi:hypothetical protein
MSVLIDEKLNGDVSLQAGSSLFDINRLNVFITIGH